MEKNILNKGITESLVQRYEHLKDDIEYSKQVTGIDPQFNELACEILGNLLDKVVWLSIGSGNSKDSRTIKVGEDFNLNNLLNIGYERVERVWNQGEISILGDVVVIWPFSMKNLVRISLLGREIEDISVVDVDSRKALKSVKERILLGRDSELLVGNEESEKSINIKVVPSIDEISESVDMGLRSIPNLEQYLSTTAILEIATNYKKRNYEIWYITKNPDKYDILVDQKVRDTIDIVFPSNKHTEDISRGFVSSVAKILVLTDLEVLGEIDLSIYQEKNIKMDTGSVDILKKIVPGDYVVHEDHGIGKFTGIVKKEYGPYIEIAYAQKDKLYIPLTASEKITKYIGAGKSKPLLTGLNSGIWKRISQKAKERAEDIAKELLQLYALREVSKGETILQEEDDVVEFKNFVKQFEFNDTDDQLLATQHIMDDFQNDKPMDRLLVGDVGYGKTEMAARAMFAVANSGRQVAVLAPTTILVQQHTSVLKERFKNYAFNIASISRFSTEKEKEEVKKRIKGGNIDIVVGTHSLLSDDIHFKNLGLLVIDEEQKFGVKQKEKIKEKRVDTNVLSLTATPIPRTLNMALSGIRDISVLATPPLGRKEVINHISKFSWEAVEEAISKELKRGGQVYFLHNRVNTIEYTHARLTKMFPQSKVVVAHGQMSVQMLSKAMDSFVSGDADILVCTTIIENGLDIPSVNTLIIDDATMLGLSQLYQIRGRIGRSQTQAYAYFFFEHLRGDAKLRLDAVRESQELGSGFLLSNKDLEIRGAGDILGSNQSGTINSVGYGLYSQMLEMAVRKLKADG